MKRFKSIQNSKKLNLILFIIFFLVIINTFICYNAYANNIHKRSLTIIQEKTDKIIYQFFTDLITDKSINNLATKDLLNINRNKKDEIISIDYNMEKVYKILTDVSNLLKNGLIDLEKGKIDLNIYDNNLKSINNHLIFYIPFFLGSNNILLNNLGPKIPVLINLNSTLLTNIKTKVTNYGLNNALLEIYITIEIKKMLITPYSNEEDNFNYNILVTALVVNGRIPNFYGDLYEKNSNILDIPLN